MILCLPLFVGYHTIFGRSYRLTRRSFCREANFEQKIMKEFTRKRVILADLGDKEMDEDEATEIALTIGAEDVNMFDKAEGNILEVCNLLCRYNQLRNTSKERHIERLRGVGVPLFSIKLLKQRNRWL